MGVPELRFEIAVELWPFLAARNRHRDVRVRHDGTSSLGHVVESLGVPLPEVGDLTIIALGTLVFGERRVAPSYRPGPGDVIRVSAIQRPQGIPESPPRFLLDVHLGTLARRLRLLGVDTAYHNDLDDDALIAQANQERRVLLTKDRGLLHRRSLWLGAYVRGTHPDEQLADTLDRFAPPLAPWTRCTACNAQLTRVEKSKIEHHLKPGTRRTYDTFAQCPTCGHIYWHGAHHKKLEAIVNTAIRRS